MECAIYQTFGLYEENFVKLTRLLAELDRVADAAVWVAPGLPALYLHVLDRSVYTTTVVLSQSLGVDHESLRPVDMKIRIYHDAQVAEVLAYQHAGRLQPFYPYPNPAMFQPYEKRRVNQFLGEWLGHCLEGGYRLHMPPDARIVAAHR